MFKHSHFLCCWQFSWMFPSESILWFCQLELHFLTWVSPWHRKFLKLSLINNYVLSYMPQIVAVSFVVVWHGHFIIGLTMLVVQAESKVLLYYNVKFFNVKGQESRVADWVNLYTSSCLEKNSRVIFMEDHTLF